MRPPFHILLRGALLAAGFILILQAITGWVGLWMLGLQIVLSIIFALVFATRWMRQQHPGRRSFTPKDFIDAGADPMAAQAMAAAINTGNPHVVTYDQDGKVVRLSEVHPPRVPLVRVDADGTIIDGTGAFLLVMDDGVVHGKLSDIRDLDGKPLPLPPGSKFEATVPLPPTTDEIAGDLQPWPAPCGDYLPDGRSDICARCDWASSAHSAGR